MKKAGIILKSVAIAFAALALNSAAYSQEAETKPATVGNAQTAPASNKMRGNNVTAAESKLLLQNKNQSSPVVTTNPEKNCVPKSTSQPYSITRKNFNNLPADRKQFVLDNSDKYTIVD